MLRGFLSSFRPDEKSGLHFFRNDALIGLVFGASTGLNDHEGLLRIELVAVKIKFPIGDVQLWQFAIIVDTKHIAPYFDNVCIAPNKGCFEVGIMRHYAVIFALYELLVEITHVVEVIDLDAGDT